MKFIFQVKEKVSDLIKIKVDQLKLEFKAHLASLIGKVILCFALLLIAFLIILFVSLALAFYLNELWGSSFLGFLTLSGLYIIILIVFVLFFKSQRLYTIIENAMIDNGGNK